ncbi:hypothetical protein TeGR_g1959, partial [Tetraparma gracilis]
PPPPPRYEQHKEDIVRILRDAFRQRMESLQNGEESQPKSKIRSNDGVRSLGNSPKGRRRTIKQGLNETIDVTVEGNRLDSPTKMLGNHFEHFSAVASSRHVYEEGEGGERGAGGRGSRPSSAERKSGGEGGGSQPGSRPGSTKGQRKVRNSAK